MWHMYLQAPVLCLWQHISKRSLLNKWKFIGQDMSTFTFSLQYLTAISPSTWKQPAPTQPSTSHPVIPLVPMVRPSSSIPMWDEPFILLRSKQLQGLLPLIVEPFIYCKWKHHIQSHQINQVQQKSNNLDIIYKNSYEMLPDEGIASSLPQGHV